MEAFACMYWSRFVLLLPIGFGPGWAGLSPQCRLLSHPHQHSWHHRSIRWYFPFRWRIHAWADWMRSCRNLHAIHTIPSMSSCHSDQFLPWDLLLLWRLDNHRSPRQWSGWIRHLHPHWYWLLYPHLSTLSGSASPA